MRAIAICGRCCVSPAPIRSCRAPSIYWRHAKNKPTISAKGSSLSADIGPMLSVRRSRAFHLTGSRSPRRRSSALRRTSTSAGSLLHLRRRSPEAALARSSQLEIRIPFEEPTSSTSRSISPTATSAPGSSPPKHGRPVSRWARSVRGARTRIPISAIPGGCWKQPCTLAPPRSMSPAWGTARAATGRAAARLVLDGSNRKGNHSDSSLLQKIRKSVKLAP
jgi:hypothetical protein